MRVRDQRMWRCLAGAAGLGGLLTLPWAVRLWQNAVLPALREPGSLMATANYNAFPFHYFSTWLERSWLIAAAVCLFWGLIGRRRWLMALALWVAMVFGLVNIGRGTWLVNNNSWAISLFLPASLTLGWGVERLATWGRVTLARRQASGSIGGWLRRATALLVLGLGSAGAGFALRSGAQAQIGIINPATILATSADAEALAWIEANTPPTALFLVNGWNWQSGIWASPDGGAWLLPVTGRATTLPPLDYSFGTRAWREDIETFQRAVFDLQEANSPSTLALLSERGITHVYIGARGGTLRPEMFANSPNYALAFTNGDAYVFSFTPQPAGP
jgi:hypothetical protein